MLAALQDLQERARGGDRDASDFFNTVMSAEHLGDFMWQSRQAAAYEAKRNRGGVPGPFVSQWSVSYLRELVNAWSNPGSKIVCLNDDITEPSAAARPLINPVIRRFLQARYSQRSQYELPLQHTNGCT